MTDTSSPTPSRCAFVHHRPFWSVLLGLQVIVSFLFCIQLLGTDLMSLWFYEAIAGFMGASLIGLFVDTFIHDEMATQILALSLFLILYSLFLYQTFRNSLVSIQYPILLTTLWLLSTVYLISLL